MSTYCTETDVDTRFGGDNIDEWLDIDNDADATVRAARVAKGIEMASDEIDNILRRTCYLIPIQDASGTAPGDVVQIAAALAGVWIYEARGSTDFARDGSPVHGQSWHRQWALDQLEAIRSGRIRIDAVYGY